MLNFQVELIQCLRRIHLIVSIPVGPLRFPPLSFLATLDLLLRLDHQVNPQITPALLFCLGPQMQAIFYWLIIFSFLYPIYPEILYELTLYACNIRRLSLPSTVFPSLLD